MGKIKPMAESEYLLDQQPAVKKLNGEMTSLRTLIQKRDGTASALRENAQNARKLVDEVAAQVDLGLSSQRDADRADAKADKLEAELEATERRIKSGHRALAMLQERLDDKKTQAQIKIDDRILRHMQDLVQDVEIRAKSAKNTQDQLDEFLDKTRSLISEENAPQLEAMGNTLECV